MDNQTAQSSHKYNRAHQSLRESKYTELSYRSNQSANASKRKQLTDQIAVIDNELNDNFKRALHWFWFFLIFDSLLFACRVFTFLLDSPDSYREKLFLAASMGTILLQLFSEICAIRKRSYYWAMTGFVLFLLTTLAYAVMISSAYVTYTFNAKDDNVLAILRELIRMIMTVLGVSLPIQLCISMFCTIEILKTLVMRKDLEYDIALLNSSADKKTL